MINFLACDEDLVVIVQLLKNVVTLIQWGIPFLLILYGLLDLGKAVMAGKEDEMKKAQKTLISRVIYAVAAFFVVVIVSYVMRMVGNTAWKSCWEEVGGKTNVKVNDIAG